MPLFDPGVFDINLFDAVAPAGIHDILYYDSVQISNTSTVATVTLNFLCPTCVGRPATNYSRKFAIPSDKDLNANKRITFILSCCGTYVTLFVAIHKTLGVEDLAVCIQKSIEEGAGGIPADWWVRPT